MIRHGLIAVLLFLALLPAAAAPQGSTKQVVILHSYQFNYEWTRLVSEGIVAELEGAADLSCEIKTEFLDAKRAWDSGLAKEYSSYLSLRYRAYRPDMVIVSDNDAFDFMLEYGDRIFGPVPWVFAGVNDFSPSSLSGVRDRVTGVVERIDYETTLRTILKMFPETNELKVLVDQSTTGPKTLHELLTTAQALHFPLPITAFPDAPFTETVEAARRLPRTTAIFLLAYARDGAGEVWSMRDVASRMSGSASGPVFAIWDFFLGHGIVGGAMTSGLSQGREAGRMALRILRGESPASIPVSDVPSPPLVLDWRALRRFKVSAARIPEGARIEFRPPGLMERDPAAFWMVLGLGSITLILTAFLLFIGVAYRRIRNSEERLAASLKEKESLLREVHHRVKNNFQVTASLLSLQAGSIEDERAREALRDSENRIRSMALVHAGAYEEKDVAEIDLGDYARSLVGNLIFSSTLHADGCRFVVAGDSISLGMERAIPLGLVLNELVTNSLKYASRKRGACSMNLEIIRQEDGGFVLRYSDDGPGLPPDVSLENPKTLGLELVSLLVEQAGGSIERDPDIPSGFRIQIRPAPEGRTRK